jgi:hypothetical protein
MILNCGKRENVSRIRRRSTTLRTLTRRSRIKNDGEYLGEVLVTVVLYGWGKDSKVTTAATDDFDAEIWPTGLLPGVF